jgi:hypothetical protein
MVYTIKKLEFKKLENLDGDWPIRRQNPYQHQFVNVNNNNYTCCAKMAGKEETPTCRKKTVTWTISIPSKSVQVF